jgi:hypothetical protein
MKELTNYELLKKKEFEDLILNRTMFEYIIYLSEINGGFITTMKLQYILDCYNKRMKLKNDILNALE